MGRYSIDFIRGFGLLVGTPLSTQNDDKQERGDVQFLFMEDDLIFLLHV